MSSEVDRNTLKSANRHTFRAFYISSDGSWQIKESVQKGYLRDITGISEIVNCNSDNNLCNRLFVNRNIMSQKKNNHKTGTSHIDLVVNKLNQNDQSLSVSSFPGSHVNVSPREKKRFSGSFKGKKHSEINSPKIFPNKSVTKFIFKDFTPEFDPSQDIFESSTRSENDFDSEFSSASKGEKSQKTNNDSENTYRKKGIKKLKKKRKNVEKNTSNEIRKFNNTKFNCVENINKDKLHPSPQKRQTMEDIVAENLTMLEELVSSEPTDETIEELMEHKKAKLKINTCTQEKNLLSKKSEHTANSNCNWINPNNITALNQDSLVTVSKEIQRKMDGKYSNVGDLKPEMRIDQVAQIESTNLTKDNDREISSFETSQEQRKRKKRRTTNVNTKLKIDRNMSIGNSNKHQMNLKTNSSQKMKENVWIKSPKKQTDSVATNSPTKIDKSQKQIDENNTFNTNLNIQLGKDNINCKVSESLRKETFKNNMNDCEGDSLTGTFLCETNLKAEENTIPIKREKHIKDKLNNAGGQEHINEEVQDKNDTYVENLHTDFEITDTEASGSPQKRKQHKNDKLGNTISIDVLGNKDKTCREYGFENPGDFSSNSTNLNEDLDRCNSETELSSNLAITPTKKIKKHKEKIVKALNFDRKNTLNYPDAKTDANSSKKRKISDEVSLKEYHIKNNKPCPGRAIVSGEQENSDTNDPEWNCADESCTNTSSSENEATRKMSKKLLNESKTHSKVQSDISSEKNPLLVSSTPFPERTKRKENFSELGENSSCSLKTSENKTNDNSTLNNQTILEEIQCKMIASESEMKALKKLKIEIDWEMSPLHQIDTGSGKVNTSKLREKLGSKHSKLLDNSKFTEEDENKIKKSWEEFSQTYNFSNPELFFPSEHNFGCFSYAERHNFKLFLAKYLPKRRLLSVYLKFVNMYGVKKKGRWSDKEDRLLLDLYFACTRDNSIDGNSKEESQRQPKLGVPMKKMMAKALDRTVISVDSRLKILLQNENAKSLSEKDIVWTPELEGALIHRLLRKSKVDSLEDLRHASIRYKVWRKVVTRLELPLDKVINHWKYVLYPQLFAHQPVFRHLLQMELIEWFYNSDIRDLKSVNWNDLSRRAGDLGSCYLCRIFITLMCNFVPNNFRKTFRESVIFLHEQYLPKLKGKTTSHMLIRKFYDPDTRTLNLRTEDEEDCLSFRIE